MVHTPPTYLNSRLKHIQLVSLLHIEDVKKYGFDAVLRLLGPENSGNNRSYISKRWYGHCIISQNSIDIDFSW